jgi:peptide-methionine (R)-S-oxide reductase
MPNFRKFSPSFKTRKMISKSFMRCVSDLQLKLSPHEYYITQGSGTERAYTGMLWFTKELGDYHCRVCDAKLFESNHKFFSKSGLPAFWGSTPQAVNVEETAVCSCVACSSHLGHLIPDGPQPTK